jgi:plastocyanin
MRRWFARLSVGLVALAFLAGRPGIVNADTIVVEVRSNVFVPAEIFIATGDTVHWTCTGGTHTTTSDDGLWESGNMTAGSTFDFTFNNSGNFDYHCRFHLACCNMAGIVHVVDPVVLTGSLSPTDIDPNAFGMVAFEAVPYRSTLSVMVGGVTSTNAVDVFVNGAFIGTITLDANGNGELDLNTDNGDTVPNLQDGDEIEVYDAMDDTTLILIGNVHSG